MSFTTNQTQNSPEVDKLAELLASFASGRRSATDIAKFSDLSRGAAMRLGTTWLQLPVEARRYLVREMVDLAESNLGLNFTRMLRLALRDPDAEVRARVIAGLWEDESSEWLDQLLECARSETDPAVREAIMVALGRFSYLAALGDLDEERARKVRAVLLANVRSDDSVSVRRRSLESLSYFASDPEVADEIARGYDSPYHEMCVSALFAMGRNLDPRWLPTVLSELASDDPELRYEAAKASGEFGEQSAVEPLMSLLEDQDREVQMAAVGALGQIGGRTATTILKRLARSDDLALQDAAQDALSQAEYGADPLRPEL